MRVHVYLFEPIGTNSYPQLRFFYQVILKAEEQP